MNSQRTGLRVAALFFGIFTLFHAVRLYKQAHVMIATHEIPLTVSWVALVVGALLCIWLWRLSSARS